MYGTFFFAYYNFVGSDPQVSINFDLPYGFLKDVRVPGYCTFSKISSLGNKTILMSRYPAFVKWYSTEEGEKFLPYANLNKNAGE